jgi:hypothetical protein
LEASSPAAQLPRYIEAFLDGDSRDGCRSGDRALGGENLAGGTGIFKKVGVANYIVNISGGGRVGGSTSTMIAASASVHEGDTRNIRSLAMKGNFQ